LYQSNSLLTPRDQWPAVASLPGLTWTTTATASLVNYYCLKAVDTNGVESGFSAIMDDTSLLNHFYLADDNITRAQIPDWANKVLLSANNNFASDLSVIVTEMTAEEINRVVKSYDISLT